MMLLQCDFCDSKCSGIIKIPCAYAIEKKGKRIYFTMPRDEEVYRNICLSCLGNETGRELPS